MIKKLAIENFESHKLSKFKFSPGLNIFVGDTSSGKSGAFRAMYHLMYNAPAGSWMVPLFWEGNPKTTIEFDNCTISRIREPNTYKIGDNNPINAGTGGPPEDVRCLVNMKDINFQSQIDKSYLMFETSGERGRVLNRLSGLEDIDRTISNSKRDAARIKSEIESNKLELQSLMEQLEEYSNIDEIEGKVDFCEKTEILIQKSVATWSLLGASLRKLENIDTKLEAIAPVISKEDDLIEINNDLARFIAIQSDTERMEEIATEYERIESELSNIPDTKEVEKKMKEIDTAIKNMNSVNESIKNMARIVRRIEEADAEIDGCESDIEATESEIKSNPKVCPTCGREL